MRYKDLLYDDDNQCCGTCRYHIKDTERLVIGLEGDWLCDCESSEYNMCYTDYTDVCDNWEGR